MGARRKREPEPPPLVIDSRIKALDTTLEKLRATAVRAEGVRHELLVRRVNEKLLPETPYEDDQISEGSHRCEGSPSGRCVYDQFEDPSFDDCLFCHEPDERK